MEHLLVGAEHLLVEVEAGEEEVQAEVEEVVLLTAQVEVEGVVIHPLVEVEVETQVQVHQAYQRVVVEGESPYRVEVVAYLQ